MVFINDKDICYDVENGAIQGIYVRSDEPFPQVNQLVIPPKLNGAVISTITSLTPVKSSFDPNDSALKPNYWLLDNCSVDEIWISDGIEFIDMCAFRHSTAKKIRWPSTCPAILDTCFANGSLESISNIDNVRHIQYGAFVGPHIKEFKWPEKCNGVPESCFEGSHLGLITGLDSVLSIGNAAFSNTKLKNLDLSKSRVCEIGIGAFHGLDRESVIPPYFVSETVFQNAFVGITGVDIYRLPC